MAGTIDMGANDILTGGNVDGRDVATDGGNQDALQTLSGVGAGSTDLGIFTGTTINDNVDVKVALQELETQIEGGGVQTLSKSGNDISISGGNSIQISSVGPTTGQVLKWTGSEWEAGTDVTTGVPGTPFYYSVDPTDFVLTNSKITQEFIEYVGPDGDYVFNETNSGSTNYVADLNLAHGSTIQTVTVYIYNLNGDNFEFWLQEKDISGVLPINTLANAIHNTAGGFDNISVGGISSVIDSSLYSYRIRIQMDNDNTGNNRIYGAVVEYNQ